MRAKFSTSLLLASLAAFPACVTSHSTQKEPGSQETSNLASKLTKPLAKEGQKTPQNQLVADPETPASPVGPAKAVDLNRSFNRLNDPSMQLMDEDIQLATSLYPATKGSLEEALVILAQLRLLKIQTEQSSKFHSRDLYEEGNIKTVTPSNQASMEKQFKDLSIDLAVNFNQNSHLKNLSTLALLKTLLDHTSNSAAFNQSLQAIIDVEAHKWAALQKSAPAAESPETPGDPVPPIAPVAVAPNPSPDASAIGSSEVHTAGSDLKRSDAILMQSQKLADKGEFKQAIEQASRIDGRDPFFDQAKEKIKVYSNRAVQDLRQKAAQAFQNAMPVADNRAKAAYLKQAKDLLEQALKEYPTADQLETVRENLAVITRDLTGIDQDVGANAPNTQ
jgi:hypothetical protein